VASRRIRSHGVFSDARIAQEFADGPGQLPSLLVVQPADRDLDPGEAIWRYGFLAMDEDRFRIDEHDLHQVDRLSCVSSGNADLFRCLVAGLPVKRSGGDFERRHVTDPKIVL